jgi:hypothetical protein
MDPVYGYYGLTLDEWCLQLMVGCPIGKPVITSCETKGGLPPVTLIWENTDSYDGIQIVRDGVVIDTISGEETSFTDGDITEGGSHAYRVIAESLSLDCSTASKFCNVGVGLITACSAPYSYISTTTALDTIDWQSDVVDDVLASGCIPGFDVGIVDTQVSVNCDMDTAAYYIDLQVFSPSDTTVVLKEGSFYIDGPDLIVTFASSGLPLSYSNDMCDCLVQPTGPGTMDDFKGEDPRGEWTMLSSNLYTYYGTGYLVDWCVGVFLADLPICPTTTVEKWFKRGDCSNVGGYNGLLDATYLLNYYFNQGPKPACLAACDANNSGAVQSLQDPLYMLGYSFSGGPAPPSPGPSTCGPDPENPDTGGAGGCETESVQCDTAH